MRQDLASYRNGLRRDDLGRAMLAAGYALPPDLRQALKRRVAILSTDLDKRGNRQIAVIVTELMAKWSARRSEADAKENVAAYVEVLQDLPPWGVAEAARRFAHGLVTGHNNAFPPAAPELYQEALKVVQPWRTERAEICELLQAPVEQRHEPPSEAERARVKALVDGYLGEAERRRQEAERQARRAATDVLAPYRRPRPDPDDLTPSPALLKSLGMDA